MKKAKKFSHDKLTQTFSAIHLAEYEAVLRDAAEIGALKALKIINKGQDHGR